MRYLITQPGQKPFLTDWFIKENNWVQGMIVYDVDNNWYSTDGETWVDIPVDHL